MLAELSGVLISLEGDVDEAARTALEERRDSLRRELRSINIDEQRPTSELLEEHTRLAVRIKAAKGEQVKKKGKRFIGESRVIKGGVPPEELNRMINTANRLDELEDRYENLHRILHGRGALESTDNDNAKP
ncbi:MAG: hypothetical protein V3S01_01870, partial [Dehalococcoidia bacterium]